MIITKTPFRMSFFGGGTDLPEFFNRHGGGSVISTTFDKFCYVTVRHLPPFFKYTTELSYARIERVKSIEKIKHPAVRHAMKMLDMHELRITYEADLPARTGLGTSSSFAVGLLNAFHALKGKEVDKRKLADEAIKLERQLCKEAGGWQDQIAASFGGFNRIDFADKNYTVTPLAINEDRKRRLNQNLLLFFTGFTRSSAEVQQVIKQSLRQKIAQYKAMLSLVDNAQAVLLDDSRDLDDFGRLLNETWLLKTQTSSKVSTDLIDEIYNKGIHAGALGGKLLGAGGGGFMLFYVQPEYQEAVKAAMKKLLYVPFEFDNDGTQIIYDSPEVFNTAFMREK